MLDSQYLRLESKAGGIMATNRSMVKACHTILTDVAKTRAKRKLRHEFIREVLNKRTKVINII